MRKKIGLLFVLGLLSTAGASDWGNVQILPSSWETLAIDSQDAQAPSIQSNPCLDPGTGAPADCVCPKEKVCYIETVYTPVCKTVYEACATVSWVCSVFDFVPGVGMVCKAGDWVCKGAEVTICRDEPKHVNKCYWKCIN